MAEASPTQKCPNCGCVHDVSVYVTGQRILCRCKLHFEVQRPPVRATPAPSVGGQKSNGAGTLGSSLAGEARETSRVESVLRDVRARVEQADRRAAESRVVVALEPEPAVNQPPVPQESGAKASESRTSNAVSPQTESRASSACSPKVDQFPVQAQADFKPRPSILVSPSSSPPPLTNPIPSSPSKTEDQTATAVCRPIEIPGYELLELIGRGGMGEVWKARQRSLGRIVAIKLLSAELAKGVEYIKRFEKEATALASLSHPNIVQIIDRGSCEGSNTWYFVMEYCEGRHLRELIAERSITPSECLQIISQVGCAIDYAHGRGVIHRDLKPENILVDSARQAKVVDFGLAGLRNSKHDHNLTAAATAMGTLHYMAPEQRVDARAVDERADIFSLGVVLYEVLTGELPVGRFKLPSERVPGVDSRLDKIVAKALQAEPSARYSTARAMISELDALLTNPQRPAAANQFIVAAEPSNTRAAWIGAAVLAMLIAGTLIGLRCMG